MGFFAFLKDLPYYSDDKGARLRMERRYQMLIEPFADQIQGARVLDLAAHDGRWSYAFAAAGAASVDAIEARPELIERFDLFPDADIRARVNMRCGDIFEGMEADIAAGRTYDIIAVFGIYYHIMEHFRLLTLLRKLSPKLVILDSEFVLRQGPVIQLVRERTDVVLNAAPQVPGQKVALKGLPSLQAMEAMADVTGYDLHWLPWEDMPPEQRQGVGDYFRTHEMRRATCALEPRGG